MFTQCEDRPYAWLICTASLTFGLVVPGATAQVPIETGAKTTLAPGSKDVADKSEGNSELPVLTRDDSERVKKLDERIAKLRKRAEYAEAIPLAQKVLSIRRRVQGDNWWETGDAHLLLKSLEQISALPAHARQELAQAERWGPQIGRLYEEEKFNEALELRRKELAARKRHLPQDSVELAEGMFNTADLLYRTGDTRNSEAFYKEALAIDRKAHGNAHPDVALDLERLAFLRAERGDHATAATLGREALAIRIAVFGAEHRLVAETLLNTGWWLMQAQEYGEAERSFSKALALQRKLSGNDDPNVAWALHCMGRLKYEIGQYASAARASEEALTIRRKFFDEENEPVANSKELLAWILIELGDYARAERLARELLPAYCAIYGERSREVALVLRTLAFARLRQGMMGEAESILREAVAMERERAPADIPDLVRLMTNLAHVLVERGDYGQAEQLSRETLLLLDQHGLSDDSCALRPLNVLAYILNKRGDYAPAEGLFRKILTRQERRLGKEHPELAYTLSDFALVLHASGDYEVAKEAFVRALALRRQTFGEEHVCVAYDMCNLGRLLSDRGDHDGAKRYLQQALAMQRRLAEDLDPNLGDNLHELAVALHRGGDVEAAERYYREALALRREIGGAGHPKVARSLIDLATLLGSGRDARRIAEAEQLFAEGTVILRDSADPNLHFACTAYADFQVRVRGRAGDAIDLYAEAIAKIERQRTRVAGDELDRSRYFTELSRADPYGGMVRAQLARADGHEYRTANRGTAGAKEAYRYLEQGRARALLDLLDRGGDNLYALALARAEREKDDSLRSTAESLHRRGREAREVALSARRRMQTIQRDATIDEPKKHEALERWHAQHAEASDAERLAARELFELVRGEQGDRIEQPVTSRQASVMLRDDELLLVYDVGEIDSLLLIVEPDETVSWFRLSSPDGSDVTAAALQAAVDATLAHLSEPEGNRPTTPTTTSAPLRLYDTLVPVEVRRSVHNASRVFIVPDGPLHRLPFETLATTATGKERWIDSGPPVVYGPSSTVLVNRRQRAARRKRSVNVSDDRLALVAAGDPIFSTGQSTEVVGPSDTSLSFDTMLASAVRERTQGIYGQLRRLPGARGEVESIASIFRRQPDRQRRRVRVLLGPQATVTNLYEAVNGPRFLHLATHGLIEGGRNVHESALALSVPKVVTPDNSGLLRLADLLSKWGGKLEGTEMVTLSACRTAQGALESGQGFVALTWGFLFAGADSVVASLWKVDDTATALFMTRFYANLLGAVEESRALRGRVYPPGESLPKAEALFEAKRWLRGLTARQVKDSAADLSLVVKVRGAVEVTDSSAARPADRSFADPFYWAAFILVGDGS